MTVASAGALSTSTLEYGDQAILHCSGEIDLATASQLRSALAGLIDSGQHRIVLDLREVSFCDSTGLGVMVGALKRINAAYDGGHLRIVCGGGAVRRVFEVTGLNRVFPLHGELPDACYGTIPVPGQSLPSTENDSSVAGLRGA